MPKARTWLIITPSGSQASLNVTSPHVCLDSCMAACDQYQHHYGEMPAYVHLSDTLPPSLAWLLKAWCKGKNIGVSTHYGEQAWLLLPAPERKGASCAISNQ